MEAITTKLNSILMALSGVSRQTTNKLCGAVESNLGFGEHLLRIVWFSIVDGLLALWDTLMKLLITIGQWVLNILDFLFVFIREFIGMNTDYSSLESITRSDIIFEFIFDSAIVEVIKDMIGLALVLIILFSIIAIIKSEYNFLVSGQGNSKKQVLVRALKSIFLIVLVPIIAIGGIILSNAILHSLYIATAGGSDVSLGTQIFVSSGYSANAYRQYAETDYKIPITYNFDEITNADNVSGYPTDGSIAQIDEAYQAFMSSSAWNKGWTTYLMFQEKLFSSMDKIDKLQKYATEGGGVSSYNQVYDRGIVTKKPEYYVMADVMDYAIKNNIRIYFKTAEDVYQSWVAAGNAVIANGDESIPIKYNSSAKTYDFDVFYEYKNEYTATEYHHTEGAKDEAEGAKFVVAIQKQGVNPNTGNIVNYYYPLSVSNNFASDFLRGGASIILARGLFYEGSMPTAIKEVDGVTEFYRDDLNVPMLADIFPVISYEKPPEGTTEEFGTKLLKMGVTLLTGVDASQLIPYVYFNFDLMHLFTKQTYSVIKLSEGFRNDYNFSQEGVVVNNVYDVSTFNIIILYFSSIMLFGILLKYMFGLSIRVVDIVLLAISYPAVVSTLPLDGGSRFKGWTKEFLDRLVATYGIVVGINLVLMICPIVFSLDLITPTMLLHSGIIGYNATAILTSYLLNAIIELLFMLVLFTSIKRFAIAIEHLLTGNDEAEIYNPEKKASKGLYGMGEEVVKDLKGLPEKIGHYVSGQFLINSAMSVMNTAMSMVPGSAIIGRMMEKSKEKSAFGMDMMNNMIQAGMSREEATRGAEIGEQFNSGAADRISMTSEAMATNSKNRAENVRQQREAINNADNNYWDNYISGAGQNGDASKASKGGASGKGKNGSSLENVDDLNPALAQAETQKRLQEYKDAHHGKDYVSPEDRDAKRAEEIEKYDNMSFGDKAKYRVKNAWDNTKDVVGFKKDKIANKFKGALSKAKETVKEEGQTIKEGLKETGRQAKKVGKSWAKFGKGFAKDAGKTAKSFGSIFKPVAGGKLGLMLMPLTMVAKSARFAATTSFRLAKNAVKLGVATAKTAYFAANTTTRLARYSIRSAKRAVKATTKGAKGVANKFKNGAKYVFNGDYRRQQKYKNRQEFINYKHRRAVQPKLSFVDKTKGRVRRLANTKLVSGTVRTARKIKDSNFAHKTVDFAKKAKDKTVDTAKKVGKATKEKAVK